MLTYNEIGIYVLVVSLLTVLVIVLVARQGRTRKDVLDLADFRPGRHCPGSCWSGGCRSGFGV